MRWLNILLIKPIFTLPRSWGIQSRLALKSLKVSWQPFSSWVFSTSHPWRTTDTMCWVELQAKPLSGWEAGLGVSLRLKAEDWMHQVEMIWWSGFWRHSLTGQWRASSVLKKSLESLGLKKGDRSTKTCKDRRRSRWAFGWLRVFAAHIGVEWWTNYGVKYK